LFDAFFQSDKISQKRRFTIDAINFKVFLNFSATFLYYERINNSTFWNREQKTARNSALKVLSYAMNNLDGKENCQAFVEMLGLAVIFPLFMKPVNIKKKKKKNTFNNEGNKKRNISFDFDRVIIFI
jgi:hypothetical protein